MDEIILRVLQIYRALSPGSPSPAVDFVFYDTTLLYYCDFFFPRYTMAKHALSTSTNNRTWRRQRRRPNRDGDRFMQ